MEAFNFAWESSEGNDNDQRAREEEVRETRSGANQILEATSSHEVQEIHGAGASSSSHRGQRHRHSRFQIHELENIFKETPNPGEIERLQIGRRLNLEPDQVKFWFQNRRTQLKNQMDRHKNRILTQENDNLRHENIALKEILKNMLCKNCGGPTLDQADRSIHNLNLKIKNVGLKEELAKINLLIAQQSDGMVANPNDSPLPPPSRSEIGEASGSINVPERTNYLELASSAMDELMKLAQVDAPLWNRNRETGGDNLNFSEYLRSFPPILGAKPLGFVSEASRATGAVSLGSLDLVEALLDADRWREMFAGMIGSSSTMEVISNGIGGSKKGVLQLMQAEIQLISPSVAARVVKFIRFCRQQADGLWAVVDLSIDNRREGVMCRRLPSGCILHDLRNGYSKVTWIEHTEYDELPIHQDYRRLLSSGLGFGAQKWICALLRHCGWLRALSSPNPNYQLSQTTRTCLKALARRMTSIFCDGVCLTDGQRWNLVSDEQIRIMTRRSMNGPGEPSVTILSATTSVWIPTTHRRLFDLLLNKELRSLWDVMCDEIATGNYFAHFPMSHDDGNPDSISLLSSDDPVLVLQETASDMTGSLIVYAPVDVETVSVLMDNGDTSCACLLPSGLYIVPGFGEGGERGSMVTVGFQMLVEDLVMPNSISEDTMNTVNNLVSQTIMGINEIVRSTIEGG